MKEDYNIKYIEIGETYYNKFVKRKRYTIEEFKNEFILKSQKKKRIPKIRIFEVLKFFEKIIDKIFKYKYTKYKHTQDYLQEYILDEMNFIDKILFNITDKIEHMKKNIRKKK